MGCSFGKFIRLVIAVIDGFSTCPYCRYSTGVITCTMYLKFISRVRLMKIDYFRAPFASHTLRVKFRLKAWTPPIITVLHFASTPVDMQVIIIFLWISIFYFAHNRDNNNVRGPRPFLNRSFSLPNEDHVLAELTLQNKNFTAYPSP